MFVPIGDSPNPERFTPWVNYGLIAANVVIFVLTYVPLSGVLVGPSDLVPPEAASWLRDIMRANPGYRPSQYDVFTFLNGYKPGAPELSDLFSAMFLHAGWSHLLGNMLFLWIYGDNVEHRLGRIPYLLTYLLTGVAATMGFALLNTGSTVPLIGASGAISGVLGMYFIMFPHNVVKVFAFIFPFIFGVYPFNARVVLGFYIIVQNIFPALFTGGQGGGVAYGAHIGG
ncbi:MAG: rhomboid family intramembrane serine protease, partial [Myxococcota bacterium]